MRVSNFHRRVVTFGFTSSLVLQLGLYTSVRAADKLGKPVPLTYSLKAQLTDICKALDEGDMRSFDGGHISARALIRFCYTYAMMHSPANPTGSDRLHVPAVEMQRIAYKFFGVHFVNTSLNAKDESRIVFKDGFYDGGRFDPDESPGGYKVVKLVPLGHQLYKASVNAVGVEPTDLSRIELTLRQSFANGRANFVVVGYSGDTANGTSRN